MKRRFGIFVFSGWVCATMLPGAALLCQEPAPQTETDSPVDLEAGGEHLRLETARGPVHIWRPADYDARTAGTVVYIHGYFTSGDQTWREDHLAAQFQASGRNALFIAPQSPRANYEEVSWKSLEDLLRTTGEAGAFRIPRGPLVVVGHSGAFRTILDWLPDPRVQEVILLDGLYSGQREFRFWLRSSPGARSHRLVLVASETLRRSDRFARRVPDTARRSSIPADFSNLTPREKRARLLFLRSQYDHLDMISSGKVIPLLLKLTALKPLPEPAAPQSENLVHRPSAAGK
ncbi:MAG: hypothetical protein ABSF14_02140 [Terriglobia bacterium]|jgi:hypothetical protein